MKILICLNICILSTNSLSNSQNERIQQYVNGLSAFFNYKKILDKYDIDIYITDNTIDNINDIPIQILNVLPKNVKFSVFNNNIYGCYNKGAGLIQTWLYNKELISQYDWFIHFEPRQLLKSFNFIENFLKNPRNLFTINVNIKHFNTGLFCLESKHLIDYISNTDLRHMINNSISIECDLYNNINNKGINYDVLDKMDLIWFATKDLKYEW